MYDVFTLVLRSLATFFFHSFDLCYSCEPNNLSSISKCSINNRMRRDKSQLYTKCNITVLTSIGQNATGPGAQRKTMITCPDKVGVSTLISSSPHNICTWDNNTPHHIATPKRGHEWHEQHILSNTCTSQINSIVKTRGAISCAQMHGRICKTADL